MSLCGSMDFVGVEHERCAHAPGGAVRCPCGVLWNRKVRSATGGPRPTSRSGRSDSCEQRRPRWLVCGSWRVWQRLCDYFCSSGRKSRSSYKANCGHAGRSYLGRFYCWVFGVDGNSKDSPVPEHADSCNYAQVSSLQFHVHRAITEIACRSDLVAANAFKSGSVFRINNVYARRRRSKTIANKIWHVGECVKPDCGV